MRKKVLIIGGSWLQAKMVTDLLNADHVPFVIDRNPDCFCASMEGIVFKPLDFSHEEKLLQYAKNISPDAIIAPSVEFGNLMAAKIAEKLALPYNAETVVQLTINKALLRQKLKNKSLLAPQFREVSSLNELDKIELNFPLIVKPVGSSGSRGVQLVTETKALEQAFLRAKTFSLPDQPILVEEYIVGEQFSIETISYRGKHFVAGITKEILSGAPDFIERSHFMGPQLYENYFDVFQSYVNELLELLEIEIGACHIEILVNDVGIYLIECASRTGGWRDRLLHYASGSNLNQLLFQSYLGEGPDLSLMKKPERNAMVGILMYPEDQFQYEEAKRKNLLDEFYAARDTFVESPKNLLDAKGYYYLSSSESLWNYRLT